MYGVWPARWSPFERGGLLFCVLVFNQHCARSGTFDTPSASTHREIYVVATILWAVAAILMVAGMLSDHS
jgi:hypothetical protein